MTVTCPSPQDPSTLKRAVSASTQLASVTVALPFPAPPKVRSSAIRFNHAGLMGSEKSTRISTGPLVKLLPSAGVVLTTVGGVVSIVKSPVV